MSSRTRVEGLRRLERDLQRLARSSDEAAKRAIEETANEILAQAQALAPVATGQLKNSLMVVIENGGLRAVVGTNVIHGPHQEFGTKFTPAQPFLMPAFEIGKRRLESRMRQEFRSIR